MALIDATNSATTPLHIEREYFTDADVWRREISQVFKRTWQLIAHESEIPANGDYVTRRMGTDHVIVARDDEGDVRVFVNACTHRGTLLCKADSGRTSHFRCGYHGWLFGNDGSLQGVPRKAFYGTALQQDQLGLASATVANFHGLIFATFSDDPVPFGDYIGDLAFYLGALLNRSSAGTVAPFGSLVYKHAGNWKLESDNFVGDGYHLAHAHRAGFELGIMGTQAGQTEGVCIQFPHGHALRAQRATSDPGEIRYPGYPLSEQGTITSLLSAEQANFSTNLASTHGVLFPNTMWLHTSRDGGMDPGEDDSAMLQFRTVSPVSPTLTEVRMWLIAPVGYSEEWYAASYKSMQRQHGPASFFESDDFENFKRIDEAATGHGSVKRIPSNFDLALEHHPYHAWFSGPGNIVGSDISEVNQRWFYRNYVKMLETSDGA